MSIRKRGEGSYQVRVYAGKDRNGRDQYRYESVSGTFRDAKAVELQLKAALGSLSTPSTDMNITLSEYTERWLSLYVLPSAAPSTIRFYRSRVYGAILPALGHMPLRSISPDHVQAFINAQTARVNANDPQGGRVKANTVRLTYRILAIIMNRAVKSGLLQHSPCRSVILPRPERSRVRAFTVHEVRQFLAAARGSEYADLFFSALLTGLRLGELLALTWNDIDFQSGLLTVRGGGSRPSQTKTPSGQRTIALPSILVHRLQSRLLEDAAKRQAQPGWNALGTIFASWKTGKPLRQNKVNIELARLLQVAGINIPDFTFHSLRGCHASLLADAGLPIRAIAERLGHSDPTLTMRLYIKSDGVQDRVKALLDTIAEPSEDAQN